MTEFMRLTEAKKARFAGMFTAVKGARKEFGTVCVKRVVDEIIKAHEDETDSESDEDVEILKYLRSVLGLCNNTNTM